MGLGDWAGGRQNAKAKGGAGRGRESEPTGGTRGTIPIWLGAQASSCPSERHFAHLLSGANDASDDSKNTCAHPARCAVGAQSQCRGETGDKASCTWDGAQREGRTADPGFRASWLSSSASSADCADPGSLPGILNVEADFPT